MMRRVQPRALAWTAMLALVALTLAAAACSGIDDVEPVSGVTTVEVKDNEFTPRVIEVPAGTEITWDVSGANPHNVIGDGWSSDTLKRGDTFAHVFDTAGEHNYECTLHGGMTGRVIVTE